jgi:hypothetical protein
MKNLSLIGIIALLLLISSGCIINYHDEGIVKDSFIKSILAETIVDIPKEKEIKKIGKGYIDYANDDGTTTRVMGVPTINVNDKEKKVTDVMKAKSLNNKLNISLFDEDIILEVLPLHKGKIKKWNNIQNSLTIPIEETEFGYKYNLSLGKKDQDLKLKINVITLQNITTLYDWRYDGLNAIDNSTIDTKYTLGFKVGNVSLIFEEACHIELVDNSVILSNLTDVCLDPTVVYDEGTNLLEDVGVRDGRTTNYGTNKYIYINNRWNAYFKFNIEDLSEDIIITEAKFGVYVYGHGIIYDNWWLNISSKHVYSYPTYALCNLDWVQGVGGSCGSQVCNAMCLNREPTGAEINSTHSDSIRFNRNPTIDTWYEWNVTDMLRKERDDLNGNNLSIMLDVTASGTTGNAPFIQIRSKDYTSDPTLRPKLTITYVDVPTFKNLWQNVTEIDSGEHVYFNITVDGEGNLDSVWLATNETGEWVNWTDGTYASPDNRGTDGSYNFTWNGVVNGRDIAWKICANNSYKISTCFDKNDFVKSYNSTIFVVGDTKVSRQFFGDRDKSFGQEDKYESTEDRSTEKDLQRIYVKLDIHNFTSENSFNTSLKEVYFWSVLYDKQGASPLYLDIHEILNNSWCEGDGGNGNTQACPVNSSWYEITWENQMCGDEDEIINNEGRCNTTLFLHKPYYNNEEGENTSIDVTHLINSTSKNDSALSLVMITYGGYTISNHN